MKTEAMKMQSKLKLKILSIESFIEEAKSSKIEDVRIACFYKTVSSKEVRSLTYFYILVTAARKDNVIIEFENEVGGRISCFEEEIAELSRKTNERGKEIEKKLEEASIKVKTGRWINE